jgi:hypothetical protein
VNGVEPYRHMVKNPQITDSKWIVKSGLPHFFARLRVFLHSLMLRIVTKVDPASHLPCEPLTVAFWRIYSGGFHRKSPSRVNGVIWMGQKTRSV